MPRLTTLACVAAVLLCGAPHYASARKAKPAELTAISYRQHCMLCHKSIPPEGIAPQILAGLSNRPGPRARELMPNTRCWRRCEKCWPHPTDKR